MSIDKRSRHFVVSLNDEPELTQDLNSLVDRLGTDTEIDVIIDFTNVSFFNSANITKLLKVRKTVNRNERCIVLCGVNTNVRGVFMVTALDKTFEFAADVQAATAALEGDAKS